MKDILGTTIFASLHEVQSSSTECYVCVMCVLSVC